MLAVLQPEIPGSDSAFQKFIRAQAKASAKL